MAFWKAAVPRSEGVLSRSPITDHSTPNGRSVGRYHRASTPHTAYITHTLLDLFCVREQESQNRKRVRTDAWWPSCLRSLRKPPSRGPLTCLRRQPRRIAMELSGSCQQHVVRVLHRIASTERGLLDATAGGRLAASLQRVHVKGQPRTSRAKPAEPHSNRCRPSKLLGQQPITCKVASIPASMAKPARTLSHVHELVAPDVIIFAVATLRRPAGKHGRTML